MSSRPATFDALAGGYDAAFTDTALGRLLRGQVWRWLDTTFRAGDRVLEFGCGTGEDAVHLASRGVAVVATDASREMLRVAGAKVDAAGAGDLVSLARLDLTDGDLHARLTSLGAIDGAYSDFGAINALADRRPLAEAMATAIPAGGRVLIVSMSPFAPWEVAWHAMHGDVRGAARRWRSGGQAHIADGAMMRVWYPSLRTLAHEFAPAFRLVTSGGIGVALPPTGLSAIVESRPRLRRALASVDRRLTRYPGAAHVADHFVAVFERA